MEFFPLKRQRRQSDQIINKFYLFGRISYLFGRISHLFGRIPIPPVPTALK